MAGNAIIELSDWGRTKAELKTLARRMDTGAILPEADYHLGFATTEELFRELSPARLALLDRLKKSGPQSIQGLAQRTGRDFADLQDDVRRLLEHGLLEWNDRQEVYVPWNEVRIRVAVGKAA